MKALVRAQSRNPSLDEQMRSLEILPLRPPPRGMGPRNPVHFQPPTRGGGVPSQQEPRTESASLSPRLVKEERHERTT